mmetsp:Transcript_45818/g.107110  ORF Transcript_45818/g.107110 Transcript_45818/m.107110 type:complete len:270 (-) Transcript_45818:178-987(-)
MVKIARQPEKFLASVGRKTKSGGVSALGRKATAGTSRHEASIWKVQSSGITEAALPAGRPGKTESCTGDGEAAPIYNGLADGLLHKGPESVTGQANQEHKSGGTMVRGLVVLHSLRRSGDRLENVVQCRDAILLGVLVLNGLPMPSDGISNRSQRISLLGSLLRGVQDGCSSGHLLFGGHVLSQRVYLVQDGRWGASLNGCVDHDVQQLKGLLGILCRISRRSCRSRKCQPLLRLLAWIHGTCDERRGATAIAGSCPNAGDGPPLRGLH